MEWLGTIIFGIVIAALARMVLPGKNAMPFWQHVIIGVIGAVGGYWLAAGLGVEATRGIDWIRWIISIAVAAVLILVVDRVTAGSRAQG